MSKTMWYAAVLLGLGLVLIYAYGANMLLGTGIQGANSLALTFQGRNANGSPAGYAH